MFLGESNVPHATLLYLAHGSVGEQWLCCMGNLMFPKQHNFVD